VKIGVYYANFNVLSVTLIHYSRLFKKGTFDLNVVCEFNLIDIYEIPQAEIIFEICQGDADLYFCDGSDREQAENVTK